MLKSPQGDSRTGVLLPREPGPALYFNRNNTQKGNARESRPSAVLYDGVWNWPGNRFAAYMRNVNLLRPVGRRDDGRCFCYIGLGGGEGYAGLTSPNDIIVY